MVDVTQIVKYLQNLHLLYVEDNSDARESTLMILNEFFEHITIAEDGQDGFEKFKENNIDLIITDINMPRLDGLGMIAKIRELDSKVSILVLSAYNESGFFMESIKLDVDGYLLKPVDMQQFLAMLDKVTQKIKLAQEVQTTTNLLNQYKEITDKSSIISIVDTNNTITYVNDAFCQICGCTQNELIGVDYDSILRYKQPEEIRANIIKTTRINKQIWQGVIKFIAKNSQLYYFKTTIKPIVDENGEIIEYITLRDDITEVMNPKKQLNDAISNAKNPVIVYMKLEDFKTLEEFYDNTTVEEIQDKITLFLEEHLPSACKFDKVYQLGNGEYALTSEKEVCLRDKEGFIKHLETYQNTIRDSVVDIKGIDYDMSMMLSIVYDDNQILESAKLGIRELLRTKQNFIIANNLAKKEYEKAHKNMQTIAMIKTAINNLKIVSYFQPIINNKTQKIEKYESLVRLIDDNGKILSPFFFLDIAKKGRYYSQITNIVLTNSLKALENTNMDISINLSAVDIELEPTRKKIFELLDKYKQYSSRIVIELLEDEGIKDFELLKTFISTVKSKGIKIAIDDFGAGYSNFERLLDYQPDILKIDGCLIRDIDTNSYSLSVVKTIVQFAKEQNIKTVGEFVENEKIYTILNELGVDYSQGYYFGKPQALDTLQ